MKVYCEAFSDWDSLMFWRPMNWRDFKLVYLAGEWAHNTGRWSFDVWLLGVGVNIQLVYNEHTPLLDEVRARRDDFLAQSKEGRTHE